MGIPTSRRAFGCWLLSAFSTIATVPALAAATPASPRQALSFGIRDRDAAAAVGRRYARQHPEEAEAVRILADQLVRLPAADRPAFLRRARAADYRAGRSVVVDGWVVSRTEMRYFAAWATS